jgi:hypothetical protein
LGDVVFRLLVSAADLRRMRFAYSPLAEITESLRKLHCGRPVPDQYRGWLEMVRSSLRRVDMPLLRAVLGPKPEAARFMFLGAIDATTTIERQLQLVADYPANQLRQDLSEVWQGTRLPPATERLLADGAGRLADALWEYWQAAIGRTGSAASGSMTRQQACSCTATRNGSSGPSRDRQARGGQRQAGRPRSRPLCPRMWSHDEALADHASRPRGSW